MELSSAEKAARPRARPLGVAGSRAGLSLGAAVVALVAAVVGAIGPGVQPERTHVEWPAKLPAVASAPKLWYTPLLLSHQTADRIDVHVPCASVPPTATERGRPVTIAATARHPARAGALWIAREGRSLRFLVGGDTFARRAVPRREAGACAYDVSVDGADWRLLGPGGSVRAGTFDAAPVVTGLFSEVDLRGAGAPSVAVETQPYGVRASAAQRLAWLVAIVALLAALVLAIGRPRIRPPQRPLATLRRWVSALRPVDGAVAVALGSWWIVGPAFYDDGWVMARQTNFLVSQGFSNYYDTYGSRLPQVYWLEWLQHWITAYTSSMPLLRLPALVSLLAVWACLRVALAWTFGDRRPGARAARWSTAAAFVVCVLAWGMTLRPEPEIALLGAGSLLCAMRFVRSPSLGSIAAALVLIVFAVAAHPAGLVVAAPLVVLVPRAVAWLRRGGRPLVLRTGAVVVAAGALLVVVLVFGSDVHERLVQADLFRQGGPHSSSWRDEFSRYYSTITQGSVPRRATLAIYALAVGAFAFRPVRRRLTELDVPALSLLVSLALLVPTPSKWMWHFGTFTGIAAAAFGFEVGRLAASARRRRPLYPAVFVVAACVGVVWAWSPRYGWGTLDLVATAPTWGFERFLSLPQLTVALAVLAVAGLGIRALRRRASHLRELPYAAAAIVPALLLLPMVVFTVALFAKDATASRGWTLTRQNVDALVGHGGCGVADYVTVSPTSTMRPTTALFPAPPSHRTARRPPVKGLGVALPGGTSQNGIEISPWYAVPAHRAIGVFLRARSSPFTVRVQWGDLHGNDPSSMEQLSDDELVRTPPSSANAKDGSWFFQDKLDLPQRPSDANAIRFLLEDSDIREHLAAVSVPVSYRAEPPLSRLISQPGAQSLVAPDILPYVPCARLPAVGRGISSVPSFFILWGSGNDSFILGGSSPFRGLNDLYRPVHIDVRAKGLDVSNFSVIRFDRRIPGAVIASPQINAR